MPLLHWSESLDTFSEIPKTSLPVVISRPHFLLLRHHMHKEAWEMVSWFLKFLLVVYINLGGGTRNRHNLPIFNL